MKIGDLAFFYHSNCKEPGIAGIAEVRHDNATTVVPCTEGSFSDHPRGLSRL